jgi:phosphoserine phosphatase
MIEPAADVLHIPRERIFANTLVFHPDGSFKGFDANEPTSRDRGKPAVIQRYVLRTIVVLIQVECPCVYSLKEKFKYEVIVMVGDGATDMQARPPADAFIGIRMHRLGHK